MRKLIAHMLLAGAVSLSAAAASGAQTAQAGAPAKTPAVRSICGAGMMTAEERKDFRMRMHNAKTAEERERLREEHYKAMQERAKERGVTLPDTPPCGGPGMGMGPRGGMGGGPR